ncbi:MAG: DUF2062 domain-containing protein, partial [Verrucomicrobiota bacterium]
MKLADHEYEEDHEIRRERHSRIRLAKKILRPLPRRATLHRYPFLKRFATSARKKPFLWSFRVEHVSPAIYVGCILAFLPAYGAQLVLGFFCALLFRCNLLVTSALVFITNPITGVPIYAFTRLVGEYLIENWNLGPTPDERPFIGNGYAWVIGGLVVGLFVGLILDLI